MMSSSCCKQSAEFTDELPVGSALLSKPVRVSPADTTMMAALTSLTFISSGFDKLTELLVNLIPEQQLPIRSLSAVKL